MRAARKTPSVAHDEAQGPVGEGVFGENDALELTHDEGGRVIGSELGRERGVGDTALEPSLTMRHGLVSKCGCATKDEGVVLGKVREGQP